MKPDAQPYIPKTAVTPKLQNSRITKTSTTETLSLFGWLFVPSFSGNLFIFLSIFLTTSIQFDYML